MYSVYMLLCINIARWGSVWRNICSVVTHLCNFTLTLNFHFGMGLTDKRQSRMEEFFQKMYELYSDFVLKSPFYAMDMPVK